jgi:hypothetical protein
LRFFAADTATLQLSNPPCAEVRQQFVRKPHGAISLLTIFDQGREQSRQGNPGRVQGMAKPVVSFRVLEPQIHSPGLVIREV